MDGVAILGATSTNIAVDLPGAYTVVTQVDDCQSSPSEPFTIVVTGDVNLRRPISLFPNPAKDVIFISGMGDSFSPLALIDALGRSFHIAMAARDELYSADISGLAAGMYTLKITQKNRTDFLKFIKH